MVKAPTDSVLRRLSRAQILNLKERLDSQDSRITRECIAQGFGNVTPRERDVKIENGTAAQIEIDWATASDERYRVYVEEQRRLTLTGTLHRPRF